MKETWTFCQMQNAVFWNGFYLHWDENKLEQQQQNISHAPKKNKNTRQIISSLIKYSS